MKMGAIKKLWGDCSCTCLLRGGKYRNVICEEPNKSMGIKKVPF